MEQFKKIYIEITNTCNLECTFCPKTKRKPEFMSVDLFKRILEQVKDHSRYLHFHVMGEPLLHPEIGSFLDICEDKGFKVNITTNGTLVKQAKEKLLFKPAIRAMNFSLHIFDENTPKKVVDAYLNEIFDLISLSGNPPGFIVCFRLWNIQNKKIQPTWINAYMLERIEKFCDVPSKIEEIPTDGNGLKLKDNVYVNMSSLFEWPNELIPDINDEGFCLGLRQQAAILVDGTVVPCCLDSEGTIDLGNINENNFKQIIEGKRAKALFKGFSERKVVESLCRKCGYRKRFDLKV